MLKLKLHSTVDIITNSSTVVYTQATESTIDTFKRLINAVISITGENYTAEDLFDFTLKWDQDRVGEWRYLKTSNEAKKNGIDVEKLWQEYEENNPAWWNNYEDGWENRWGETMYADRELIVSPRSDNDDLKRIAKLVEGIIDTYNIESTYNG